MSDKRDDDIESAGTAPGRKHATDALPDGRPREEADAPAMNDRGQLPESPDGDQIPPAIAGNRESASSPRADLPSLGDEGGGSRYGDDDGGGEQDGNEYSGPM